MEIPFRFDKATQEILLYPERKDFDDLVTSLFHVGKIGGSSKSYREAHAHYHSFDNLLTYEPTELPLPAGNMNITLGKAKIIIAPKLKQGIDSIEDFYAEHEKHKTYRKAVMADIRKVLREKYDTVFRWAYDEEVPIVHKDIKMGNNFELSRFFLEIPPHYNAIMTLIDRAGYESGQYVDYKDSIRALQTPEKLMTPSCDVLVKKGTLDIVMKGTGKVVSDVVKAKLAEHFPLYEDPTSY